MRTMAFLRYTLIGLVSSVVLTACNNNRVMTPDESASTEQPTAKPNDSAAYRQISDTASPAAMIPATDSLPIGDGPQYEIPDSNAAADAPESLSTDTQSPLPESIETGPAQPVTARQRRSSDELPSGTTDPVATFRGLTKAEMASAGTPDAQAAPPRSGVEPAPTTSNGSPSSIGAPTVHPATQFKGLNPAELRSIPGYRLLQAAEPTRRTRNAEAEARERLNRPSPRPGGLGSMERQYIDGVAAARAGDYAGAIEKLGQVINTPGAMSRRDHARYYYGRSLEGAGRLQEAADQYRTVSRGRGNLAHVAYIDHCRLLGRLGERNRARTLVQQFLRQHPDSNQVAEARRLLQTL